MTIQKLLQDEKYQQKRVLENLICHFLGIGREEIRLSVEQKIDEKILKKILEAYDDFVIDKKPLEYVLGYVEFMGNQFKIDHRALIPRPETEYMIQAVNDFISQKSKIKNLKSPENILLDIGTGCGVLGLSVILHNLDFFEQAYLSEYIDYTLSLAEENLEKFQKDLGNTKINLVKSDLLDFVIEQKLSLDDSEITLVANLPYIPEQMFEQNVGENVKNWEPKPAFVSGEDGLDHYRQMFEQIFEFQKNGILKSNMDNQITMFLEMMTWQVEILRKEFGDKLVFEEVKTFHFNIRIVKASWKK